MTPTSKAPNPWDVAAGEFELTGAARWYNSPTAFAHECIKWKPGEGLTSYQDDILDELSATRRIAVRGPHGLGKTAITAITVHWFALTRDGRGVDWKIATTAGSWRQLIHYLWPEIHKFAGLIDWDKIGRSRYKSTELQNLNLKLRYGNAFAVAATNPALLEGMHADSVLYCYDESKAIQAGTFDASEGAFSGAKPPGQGLPEAFALATSTPGDTSGRFYDIHMHKPGFQDWKTRHVKLHEAIAAERIDPTWAENRRLQWGEHSQVYHNRVLGEFKQDESDGVIPLAWIEAAIERWQEWNESGRIDYPGRRVLGVDVGLSGPDPTVIAPRRGPVVYELTDFHESDTRKNAMRCSMQGTLLDQYVVDSIGIGAGVLSVLRGMERRAFGFNAAKSANGQTDRSGDFEFMNLRAYMWWNMREKLDPAFDPTLMLPPDDQMTGELALPRWTVNSSGRIKVESKDEIRQRNEGRSTDRADAVLQTLVAEENLDAPETYDGGVPSDRFDYPEKTPDQGDPDRYLYDDADEDAFAYY